MILYVCMRRRVSYSVPVPDGTVHIPYDLSATSESAVVIRSLYSDVVYVAGRVATPLASLILLLPLPYSCPHNISYRSTTLS